MKWQKLARLLGCSSFRMPLHGGDGGCANAIQCNGVPTHRRTAAAVCTVHLDTQSIQEDSSSRHHRRYVQLLASLHIAQSLQTFRNGRHAAPITGGGDVTRDHPATGGRSFLCVFVAYAACSSTMHWIHLCLVQSSCMPPSVDARARHRIEMNTITSCAVVQSKKSWQG